MPKTMFEKVLAGEAPMPEAAATLGAEILEVDATAGKVTVQFEATQAFTNPVGDIQGGFLAAMLDDTMGPALVCTLAADEFAPTLELKTNFIRPGKVGPMIGFGSVVSKGGAVCFIEGELLQEGQLIAKASATALIRKIK